MNILHFKYAVAVDETKSISKAAEALYMGQPNLSRAIKELESSLGITIFKRTPRGITTTPEGEEFLRYARKITSMVDEVERIYVDGKSRRQRFAVCVPRASYIACSFAAFTRDIGRSESMEISYKETNAMETIDNVLRGECGIGIVRYQTVFDRYFNELFDDKRLVSQELAEFRLVIIVSKNSPIANKELITPDDLSGLTEITHSDPYVPAMSQLKINKAEFSESVDRRIFVFDRGIQFELLESNYDTFMWVSPVPEVFLKRHGLVQKTCILNEKTYKDLFIWRKGYKLTQLDHSFIDAVNHGKSAFIDSEHHGDFLLPFVNDSD
ncbi:MAG: LysR family transcriptional regulator [Ruminococcus sp.]|nr:LysR family transcriptional regulator [Ruminococcus sp.]